MSTIRSSTLNLYSCIDGDHLYQQKVLSDKITLTANLPVVESATKFDLVNSNGHQVLDVVETILAIKQKSIDDALMCESKMATERAFTVAQVAAVNSTLATEVSERNQDILEVEAAITAETGARQAALTLEIQSRAGADAVLQSNLTSEIARAIAAEEALQTNINDQVVAVTAVGVQIQADITAEITRATAAELLLQSNLTAETTARADADTALSALIDVEVAARNAAVLVERNRINTLLSSNGINYSNLLEMINAYQTGNTSLLSQISSMNSLIQNLQSGLAYNTIKLDTALNNAPPCGPNFPAGIYNYTREDSSISVNTITIDGNFVSAVNSTEAWGTTSGSASDNSLTFWGNVVGTWNPTTQSINWSNGTVWVYQPPQPVQP
jgi:hypothetical protein